MKLTFPGGQEFTLLSPPLHEYGRIKDTALVPITRDIITFVFSAADRAAIEALVKDGAWPNVQRDNLTRLEVRGASVNVYTCMYIFLTATETDTGKYSLKLASMGNAAEVAALEKVKAAQAQACLLYTSQSERPRETRKASIRSPFSRRQQREIASILPTPPP